jgi:predicted amidophosphoribosyltransferase
MEFGYQFPYMVHDCVNAGTIKPSILAKVVGGRVETKWLFRTRNNEHQARLAKSDRAQNAQGIFKARIPTQEKQKSQVLVLVDDVMTTGATLANLAQVLQVEYPQARIVAVTWIRAQGTHGQGDWEIEKRARGLV